MFKRIVVPLDGSTFGELALPFALGIACRSGGEVRIVTVITPLSTPHPAEELLAMEVERLAWARADAEGYLRDLQKRAILEGCDVPVSAHVEEGPVAARVDKHAREARAGLLVMTTHGRGPLRRAWLGSVADGLIRRTPCPVLAVRPGEGEELSPREVEFRHLLVTLDGSQESREILPHARELSRITGARLTLLRVLTPHFPVSSPYLPHASQEMRGHEMEEGAARRALEVEAEALREEGFQVEVRAVPGAHPAQGILGYAREAGVDLIAMATHGRGGVSRLVLGSVADKVVRGGTAPVLLHRTS